MGEGGHGSLAARVEVSLKIRSELVVEGHGGAFQTVEMSVEFPHRLRLWVVGVESLGKLDVYWFVDGGRDDSAQDIKTVQMKDKVDGPRMMNCGDEDVSKRVAPFLVAQDNETTLILGWDSQGVVFQFRTHLGGNDLVSLSQCVG